MKPNTFQEQNEPRWRELEGILQRLDKRTASEEDKAKLPRLFRQVCSDLSLAQQRMYGAHLCDRLNNLVVRGYNRIYRDLGSGWARILEFVWFDLPGLVRKEWRLFVMSNLFFWVPFVAMALSTNGDLRWIQATLGPEGMANMEMMYGEDRSIGEMRRHFGSNFQMFAFYIMNNVSIDFRIFAGGIVFGLGTLYFLLFNGVMLGAATGYVHEACSPENFYTFVAGHSSFEFLGMFLAGMAGLRLGLALLNPGRLSRKQALTEAGKRAVQLLYGAAGLTLLAALVEGFWSPLELPPMLKYVVGISLWVVWLAYFALAGLGRRAEA